jgi:hypothetical protein
MKTLLYQDESILFELNETLPAIEFKPKGLPRSPEHLKQAYYMLVRFCEEQTKLYEELNILIDIRDTDGITSQDNEWIAAEIIPKLIGLGIKKLALVDGVTEMAHITSEEFLELSMRSPLQHRLFKEPESGRAWLLHQN